MTGLTPAQRAEFGHDPDPLHVSPELAAAAASVRSEAEARAEIAERARDWADERADNIARLALRCGLTDASALIAAHLRMVKSEGVLEGAQRLSDEIDARWGKRT